MTTTISDLEAVPPPSPEVQRVLDLTRRANDGADRVLHTAKAEYRVRHAMDGEKGGLELNNRVRAWQTTLQAHQAAIDGWMSAEAKLAQALAEEEG